MRFLIPRILAASLPLLSAALAADTPTAVTEGEPDVVTQEILKSMPQIADAVQFPEGAFHAVLNTNGQLFFLSPTGRYVMMGMMYDAWEKRPLQTINQMRDSFSHIRPTNMGVKVADLDPIVIGKGTQEITIFVDPQCHWCHELIKEIRKDQTLLKNYRVNFLVVPALGDVSADLTRTLFCSSERRPEKLLSALTEKKIDRLPAAPKCNTDKLDRRLVFAQMIGVKAVPFILAPDGRWQRGKPQDLHGWLKDGDRAMKEEAAKVRASLKQAAEEMQRTTGTPQQATK